MDDEDVEDGTENEEEDEEESGHQPGGGSSPDVSREQKIVDSGSEDETEGGFYVPTALARAGATSNSA